LKYAIPTKNKKLTLTVSVLTKSPQKIQIATVDKEKPYTVYTTRAGWVNGKRKFEVPLPETPENLTIHVFNEKNGWKIKNDPTFKVEKFGIDPLKTWQIWMTPDQKEFLEFAQQFSENAGILATNPNQTYKSRTGKYQILYTDDIRNDAGKVLSTPARISNKTAIIEISKNAFIKYSVQMRMIILLHEFSHFYVNKIKKNEAQADLNALYFFLGSGYSPIEAHRAFLSVFDNADSAQNEMRYQLIKKYIIDFMDGKIAEPVKNTNVSVKKAA
jgi:hypothetical protein